MAPQRIKYILLLLSLIIGLKAQSQVKTSISGYITDEQEAPLFGATVFLSGTSLGASTDEQGFYTISNITPGTYNLTASYIGYESQTQYNIQIKSVGNQLYSFTLIAKSETLDEIQVSPDQNVISRPRETPLSTQTLTATEIATYPGGNNDVVSVAQSLPGISPSVGGFRNDLIIRGGAPNESVYYLDGMEIPHINHFSTQGSSGGPVGLLNIAFVDNVTLATSAFGAHYDNALSGVLQFKQREGNPRNTNTNIRISASETALTLNGPLFKGNKEVSRTTYIISARRSYLQFLFELIGLPIRPDYWDYQYKITHQIDDYNSLLFLGVGSIDDFTIEGSDDLEPDAQSILEQAPFIEQRTNTTGIMWKHRFKNNKGYMHTTVSNNFLNNNYSRYRDNETKSDQFFMNDSRENETKLRYKLALFHQDWKFTTGFNVQHSHYTNETFDDNFGINYDTELNFMKYGVFANATHSFFENRLDLTLGMRLDADSYTSGNSLWSTFSPRLALSYEFIPDWKLNATVGRYHKLPPYTILGFQEGNTFVNKDVKYTRSDHYVIGLEHVMSPASSISLEGFYKKYNHYPVSLKDQISMANKGADFNILGNEAVETVGLGRSYGLEFLLQQKLTNNFYGIFSYTFFYSEFTGLDRQKYRPSTWDSRHLISFTGGYQLKKNWEISGRLRFAGKTPYAPVDKQASIPTYPDLVLNYDQLGTVKMDVFNQLDVRIDKKWNFRKMSLDLFFEIQNALGTSTPEPPEHALVRDDSGNVITPIQIEELEPEEGSMIPVIGFSIDF
ncbi:TonB-dependent receptor [Puteibacter caeruleilacunae]|nr:TonB-dependent receptor [Puteibacter caeruleilacunae]